MQRPRFSAIGSAMPPERQESAPMSRPTSIRKAAILVSLLDVPSADALLESMGEELSDRVRSAVMELDDVSDAEQEEVLAEFFGHGGSAADAGVELELSD